MNRSLYPSLFFQHFYRQQYLPLFIKKHLFQIWRFLRKLAHYLLLKHFSFRCRASQQHKGQNGLFFLLFWLFFHRFLFFTPFIHSPFFLSSKKYYKKKTNVVFFLSSFVVTFITSLVSCLVD